MPVHAIVYSTSSTWSGGCAGRLLNGQWAFGAVSAPLRWTARLWGQIFFAWPRGQGQSRWHCLYDLIFVNPVTTRNSCKQSLEPELGYTSDVIPWSLKQLRDLRDLRGHIKNFRSTPRNERRMYHTTLIGWSKWSNVEREKRSTVAESFIWRKWLSLLRQCPPCNLRHEYDWHILPDCWLGSFLWIINSRWDRRMRQWLCAKFSNTPALKSKKFGSSSSTPSGRRSKHSANVHKKATHASHAHCQHMPTHANICQHVWSEKLVPTSKGEFSFTSFTKANIAVPLRKAREPMLRHAWMLRF